MTATKILVAQGGGPTAVINQSLVGVVLEARRIGAVDRIYGARHGVRGIVNEDFVDLTQETSHNLEMVAATPGSALGSTRDKPDLKYCQQIFEVLRAHGIGHFFYIGGNDSSDTVRIVSEEAAQGRLPAALHPHPEDHRQRPGAATTTRRASRRRRASWPRPLPAPTWTTPRCRACTWRVVMGRHAGFLTAASALGKKFPDDGPHLIYLPERDFAIDKFLADVKATYERYGRCVVAVSEGIHDASGQPIMTQLAKQVEHDAHGNVQLSGTGALADLLCDEIKAKLGIKRVRGDTFGYLQRSFIGCVTDVDAREAREVGEKAVQYAMWGDRDGSVAIKRTGFYSVDYELVPLKAVAGKTRVMEDALHRRQRHRRHRRLPPVPAAAAGFGHARRLPAAPGTGGSSSQTVATSPGPRFRGGGRRPARPRCSNPGTACRAPGGSTRNCVRRTRFRHSPAHAG